MTAVSMAASTRHEGDLLFRLKFFEADVFELDGHWRSGVELQREQASFCSALFLMIYEFNGYLAIDDLDFVNQILSSDFLKMTDAERIAVLKEKEVRSKEMVGEIQRKSKRYRDIISFREMQEAINNRKTNY